MSMLLAQVRHHPVLVSIVSRCRIEAVCFEHWSLRFGSKSLIKGVQASDVGVGELIIEVQNEQVGKAAAQR